MEYTQDDNLAHGELTPAQAQKQLSELSARIDGGGVNYTGYAPVLIPTNPEHLSLCSALYRDLNAAVAREHPADTHVFVQRFNDDTSLITVDFDNGFFTVHGDEREHNLNRLTPYWLQQGHKLTPMM